MKRYVNGVPIELTATGQPISWHGDRVILAKGESAAVIDQGNTKLVSFRGAQYKVERRVSNGKASAAGSGEMRAMMPGQITDVRVTIGDQVEKGQTLLVLEAMKTQQPFLAPFDGVVKSVSVSKGEQVSDGQVLAIVEATK